MLNKLNFSGIGIGCSWLNSSCESRHEETVYICSLSLGSDCFCILDDDIINSTLFFCLNTLVEHSKLNVIGVGRSGD